MKINYRYLSNPRSRRDQTKSPCLTSLTGLTRLASITNINLNSNENNFHGKKCRYNSKKRAKKPQLKSKKFKIIMQKAKEEFINQEAKTRVNSPSFSFSNAKINLNLNIFQNFMLHSLKSKDESPQDLDLKNSSALNPKNSNNSKNSKTSKNSKYSFNKKNSNTNTNTNINIRKKVSKIHDQEFCVLGLPTKEHSTQTQVTVSSNNSFRPTTLQQISSHNFQFRKKNRDFSFNHLCNFSNNYSHLRKLPVKSKLSMNSINSSNLKNSKKSNNSQNSNIDGQKLNTSAKGRTNDLRGLNTCEISRKSSKLNIHDEKNHKFPDLFFKLKRNRIPFKIQLMLIK